MKRCTKYLVLALVVVIFVIVVGIGSKLFLIYMDMKEKVSDIEFSELELSELEDGEYYGSYSLGIVSAKVCVSVSDGKIDDIEIVEHITGRGKKAEDIVEAVIDEQSVMIDIISGATYSSKTILKAIENAVNYQ